MLRYALLNSAVFNSALFSTLLYSQMLNSTTFIPLCSFLLCSFPPCSFPLCSTPKCSTQQCSILLYSIQFCSIPLCLTDACGLINSTLPHIALFHFPQLHSDPLYSICNYSPLCSPPPSALCPCVHGWQCSATDLCLPPAGDPWGELRPYSLLYSLLSRSSTVGKVTWQYRLEEGSTEYLLLHTSLFSDKTCNTFNYTHTSRDLYAECLCSVVSLVTL